MSFIRPEARIFFLKWREVLIGLVVLLLGLYWVSGSGILRWIGVAVAIGGGILMYTGLQRGRFMSERGGPGIVTVDEGEVSYYGPISGGIVSMSDLTLLTLDQVSVPPVWVLHQIGQADIAIPVNAEGAEALFDAFASLPGIRTDHLVSSLNGRSAQPVVIWAKEALTLH
ncbi:hypothetical protein NBRC116601_27850 [Cognatishimia sp. WU-CL00825]|uniref:hypothetical protein n=1 Tax=Cognatishimia sp. WU-CL00825 TaxID=3127658 RepID=UPI003109D1C6